MNQDTVEYIKSRGPNNQICINGYVYNFTYIKKDNVYTYRCADYSKNWKKNKMCPATVCLFKILMATNVLFIYLKLYLTKQKYS